MPERYNKGIFEVEKNVKDDEFSTHVTKRTRGIVEGIEDDSKTYAAAASFVEDRKKIISSIRLRTEKGIGVVEFPRQLSTSERDTLIGREISYEEKYSCYDEGAYTGLLQGWHYTIETLNDSKDRLKLKEDITV